MITQAPNVVSASFGTVNIRGISGSGAATGGIATTTGSRTRVSTSVDGVADAYTGYNFSGSGVWDVQQIEVLRGPQSTTQGENSIGGAVSVKTNDPVFNSEYAIKTGFERYENGNFMKNVAVMASGPLSEELAYRVAIDGTDGQGYLSYDGNTAAVPVDPEDSSNINFRGKLLWEPAFNEDLSIKLTGNYRKADGSYVNWANWDDGTGYEDETMTLGSIYVNGLGRTISYNTRIQDSDMYNLSSEINYILNDQISSVTILSMNDQTNIFDQYPTNSTYNFQDKTNTFESRLLLKPTNYSFKGFIGIMAADRENTINGETDSVKGETLESRIGVFAESNYQLSDKATLIAGGRLQYEEQDRSYNNSTVSIEREIDDLLVLPKLALIYSIMGNTTLGLSARKGYNSGGVGYNTPNSEVYDFDSESVYAYELSSKTTLKGGTTISAALFYNDYQDFQGTTGFKVTNVAESHTTGVEIEATHWLTDNLEIRPSIGFMKSKIDQDANYQGNELSNAPELNASLAFTQFIGDNLTLSANVTYVSEYYSDLVNTEDYKAGNYAILDTSIDYTINDLLVSAYVTNLTDEDVVYLVNGGYRASVGQSRTFGLNFTYKM